MTHPLPQDFPLGDLLSILRERRLAIGVREHMAALRLLDRWQGTDPDGFRDALAAVLARDATEARRVRETFDELYRKRAASPPGLAPAARPSLRRHGGMVVALALALLVLAKSLGKEGRPSPVVVPPAPASQSAPSAPPEASRKVPPPRISETFAREDEQRALSVAAGLALLVLLWLCSIRLRREAGGLGRRLWRRELDVLPRPHVYELALEPIAPALAPSALDQAARLLARSPTPPKASDLDVGRSLEATIRAGGAPRIVLRERSSPRPLVVLQDTGGEMRPWRRSVSQLLAGLEARGVALDLWQFHADAGRVSRGSPGEVMSLERLAHLRADSPLLVVSTGEGLTHRDGRPSSWVATLLRWGRRAWLHPVTDPAYWRPQLRLTSTAVFPLTSGGAIAAAHHLAAVPGLLRTLFPLFPDRPVAPLDVDRLRWLLSLTSRRDADLLELLRQRFFPKLPPAAVLDAWESAPLARRPGRRPEPEEVHELLADLLSASPPKPGSAAHGRWTLDRALHEARIPARREQALQQLRSLVAGPFAGEVERATRRPGGDLPPKLLRAIRHRAVEEGLAAGRDRGGRRWRGPDGFELGVALLSALLFAWGLGRYFVEQRPVGRVPLYKLEVVAAAGPEPAVLLATPDAGAPAIADLYQQNRKLGVVRFRSGSTKIAVKPPARGSWYYLRSWMSSDRDRLAISNRVWVDPAAPPSPVHIPPPKQAEAVAPASEPLTDSVSRPLGSDPSAPRFGTLTADGEVRGAPRVPAATDAPPLASRQEGTLTIEGFPEDLPPQMIRVVTRGSALLNPMGIIWSGKPLTLAPGDYLLIADGPDASVSLVGTTVSTGSDTRLKLSPAELKQLRNILVLNDEDGPAITGVSPGHRETEGGRLWRTTTVQISIHGTRFDPDARVSFGSRPSAASFGSCQVQESVIDCKAFLDAFAPPGRLFGSGEVKVVNPDGRYTVYNVDYWFLLGDQF